MERRNRYTVLGLTDGLFLGVGISLGVSFFNSYKFTLISILIVGISGALSNLFAIYNAEEYVTGEQIREYKRILFAADYNPKKIRRSRHMKSIKAAVIAFSATLIGSIVVLLPYIAASIISFNGIIETSLTSLVLSLIVLGYVGSRNREKSDMLKGALKTSGIGLMIAAASAAVGFILTSVL